MIAPSAAGAADLLARVPAFSELAASHREELAARCELRLVSRGASLIPANGGWAGVGVLIAGEARLLDERNGSTVIDSLSAGAVFAHDSLLSDLTFPYSAYATNDCTVLLLARPAFEQWLAARPALSRHIRESVQHHEVRELIRRSLVIPSADSGAVEQAVMAARERRLAPGELLFPSGERSPVVYLVRSGRLRVSADGGAAVGFLEAGQVADDSRINGDGERRMNVIAETDTQTFAIPAAVFRSIAGERRDSDKVDALLGKPTGETTPAAPAAQEEADAILQWKLPEYQPSPSSFSRLRGLAAVRQQSAMDCGAACLATLCAHYGKRISLNRLRELARVGTAGASMLHLMQAARELGFETVPILSTLEHLRGNRLPALINWKGYHWLVVYGVGDRHVTVADPARGLVKLPIDEFTKGWTRYTLYLRPTPEFANLEASPPTLTQFIPYLVPYRRILVEIGLASLAMQILALMLPVFTQFIIDEVIVSEHRTWLSVALVAVSFAIGLQWLIAGVRQRLLLYVAQRVNVRLMADFYRHILRLPLPYFERRRVGDVTTRLEENTKITTFFTTTGIDFLIDTVTAVLYFGLMFHYNVQLSLVVASFFMLHFVNVYAITPRLQQGFREVFERSAELTSHTIEGITGLRTIRTLGVEHSIRSTWESLYARFTNAYFKTLKYGIASGLASQIVNIAGSTAVLFYGATLVLNNQLSVGALVAFGVLVQGAMTPVTKLVSAWDQLQETLNAVERLNDVYENPPEAPEQPGDDLVVLPPLNGHLRFDAVTFRYDPEGRNVLQNVTLEIHRGQRIAFVGRSGSGKSTLVKLILGFYRPTSGRITVDGFDLTDVWLPSLRRQIGVVPQDSFLFHGSIRDNIAQARPDATSASVEWAATLAHAHEFIIKTPNGYETMLNEQGLNLSGGQRQRLAIARAILQRPRMIVLDEATSALDNESERRFMHNMDEAFPGRTVLMIAHRLSTVRHADLIVVLDRGAIVEQGTHDELMGRGGLYYFIATQQLRL